MLSHLRVRYVKLRTAVYAAMLKRLPRSDVAWAALDRAGVGGHGLNLLRFDFPPALNEKPAWGYGLPSHPALEAWLARDEPQLLTRARELLAYLPELTPLPLESTDAAPLAWRNRFQTPLDLALDYGMLRSVAPRKYVEVGSGLSTLLAAHARANGTPCEIVSIDPAPRANIGRAADRVIRHPLERCVDLLLAEMGPGTMLFVDGSHFSFPGSDVTRFILDVLPRLPAGTVVHVHDIYLPDDYPARHFRRLWNEQYLLAAWLLGGAARLKPLAPGHWLASRIPAALWDDSRFPAGFREARQSEPDASCWWMQIE